MWRGELRRWVCGWECRVCGGVRVEGSVGCVGCVW